MTEHAKSFMKPIWTITILSMLGTSILASLWHIYVLRKNHAENKQMIDLSGYRAKQYAAYKETLQKEGRERTLQLLKEGKI